MYGYILTLGFCLAVSVGLLQRLETSLRTLVKPIAVLYVIGVVWDAVAVTQGWWTFSEEGILGLKLILPIEEYIFMFTIPLLCISVYETIRQKGW